MFYGKVGIRYLFRDNPEHVELAVKVFQIIALVLVTVGAALDLPVIWNQIDFGVAFLVFFNVYALFRMYRYVEYVLKDYLKQYKSKKEIPVWDFDTNIKADCK